MGGPGPWSLTEHSSSSSRSSRLTTRSRRPSDRSRFPCAPHARTQRPRGPAQGRLLPPGRGEQRREVRGWGLGAGRWAPSQGGTKGLNCTGLGQERLEELTGNPPARLSSLLPKRLGVAGGPRRGRDERAGLTTTRFFQTPISEAGGTPRQSP